MPSTDPVAEIAQHVKFFRRITTLVLLGLVLAGAAFAGRTYLHGDDGGAAYQACVEQARPYPDRMEAC